MKIRLVTSILLVVVLCLLLIPITASADTTVYVPDDYSNIQAAVDAASDGDTIIVRDGSYTENIDVTKPLTIQSESGADSTTVTASNPDDHVFYVSTDSVTISGFTVTGTTGEKKAGIYLGDGADHCTISNNTVSNNYYGIHLDASSDNTLQNNTCHSNSNEGIFLWSSCNYNTIDNNTSYSNGAHGGIFVWKSCSNNTITNNKCHSNPDHGIKIHESSDNNLLENNTCFGNGDAIFVGFSDNNEISNNTCTSNTREGIYLRVSSHNLIVNNVCESNTVYNIKLAFCNYHNILENNICTNGAVGIGLCLSSNNNTVVNNKCNSNDLGIHVRHSNYNEILYNTIELNGTGGKWDDEFKKISGVKIDGGKDDEWDEFERLEGYWSKYKEQVQAKGVEIEGENSIGNKISWNNITGNVPYGVLNNGGAQVDATLNWWGDESGPGGAGRGNGDAVSDYVDHSPWLDTPYPEGKPISEIEAEEEPPQPPTPEGINWWLVTGIAAAIVILGSSIYFFIRRRKEV